MLDSAPPPRLLDRVRATVRARHFSRRTEKAYVSWTRRFILFHDKRHPAEMGGPEVSKFLSALAVEGDVAASTQNQALSALLFLYREVLGQTLRVVGVDINPRYIEALSSRYAKKLPNLELHVADVQQSPLPFEPVDFIYAALVFEYVALIPTLRN